VGATSRFAARFGHSSIATRYDRSGERFFSAICIATPFMFWL
jgi:hypothetical protein